MRATILGGAVTLISLACHFNVFVLFIILQIQLFLSFVKSIYSDLPKHLPKIFEPRSSIRVKDLKDINLDQILSETYTITTIQAEKKAADGVTVNVSNANRTLNKNHNSMPLILLPFQYTLIPKGILSLKVLQELPIIVVLMYQIYKQYVHQEVADFVPLIMATITLQPSPALR